MAVGQTSYPDAIDTVVELLEQMNNAGTTLTAGITDSDTVLTVASTAAFPAAGEVVCEGEHITYTGKTSTTFTGCVRGQFQDEGGAAASAHGAPAKVELLNSARYHNVLVDAIIALQTKAGTTNATRRPRDVMYVVDDFATGATSSGTVGELAWTAGGGAITAESSETDHPGIIRRSTGTTINTTASLSLRSTGGPLATTNDFEMTWIVRPNAVNANHKARIGGMSAAGSDNPSSGIYFERLGSEANWQAVCRLSGTETRVDTGVAYAAAWVRLMIRKVGGTVTFWINDAQVASITTNVPPIAAAVAIQIVNTDTTAHTIDVDWFELVVTGLDR